MPNDATVKPQPEENAARRTGVLGWFRELNHGVELVKGLSIFTVLSSIAVGYFQYYGEYQEKVSAQAREDMKGATDTFTDVSKRFSEAQKLQQILFLDFSDAFDESAQANKRAGAAKHAQSIVPTYEASAIALLESGDLIARDAEIYIDWASDFKRDSNQSNQPSGDPLTRPVLKAYDFDCNDDLPQFVPADAATAQAVRDDTTPACLLSRSERLDRARNSTVVNLCPRQRGVNDPPEGVTIDWFSAKHQALTLQYCFETLHERLARVRSWAAHPEGRAPTKEVVRTEREQLRTAIDNQARRLEAFMGLATFRMEAIRLNYRPVGVLCRLPIISSLTTWWDDSCTPVITRKRS
ncbi:hypothetical protein [Afipia sp. GAS231]|uniref:hypothetical protein n=1 Tax=Afipia sp. GAS231 TaxID=1882747 RepID=UPI00087B41EA|nr:hypothetical protein [Afipia sp. GAS231]SDO94173.1 hypothetical protein SAMN05444050_5402 [Afipia sp. GAS231]